MRRKEGGHRAAESIKNVRSLVVPDWSPDVRTNSSPGGGEQSLLEKSGFPPRYLDPKFLAFLDEYEGILRNATGVVGGAAAAAVSWGPSIGPTLNDAAHIKERLARLINDRFLQSAPGCKVGVVPTIVHDFGPAGAFSWGGLRKTRRVELAAAAPPFRGVRRFQSQLGPSRQGR